jgi:prepilin-type N-terminal cleavage/methylation domain-containing protein
MRKFDNRIQNSSQRRGFTIVELLIVIVVIGILAALTIVAYNGIQGRAIASTLQSDLDSASKQLKLYQVDHSAYPTSIDCSAAPAANSICLKSSGSSSYTAFQVSNATSSSQAFCLTATNNTTSYRITNDGTPTSGSCSGVVLGGTSCPSGFIVVPGSSTYGTSDFCVMKYEAKIAGQNNGNQTYSTAFVAESRADGTPWVNISQTNAITAASTVVGCSTCHLITEAEYLTIAQNVLSVPSNWSGGAVGSGYIYSGHNDNAPGSALAANTNDSNGYYGETNTGGNQRRTLTLTNGEVIWDLAGNVWEWTQGTINGGAQPGLSGETAYSWRQYNNNSLLWNGLPSGAQPANVYSGAGSWSSTQGIGQLYSNYGEPALHGFLRGSYWNGGVVAGVLALDLDGPPSNAGVALGFRAVR